MSILFPERVQVDGLPVDAFADREALLKRLVYEVKKPGKALFFALNVHNANMCVKHPGLKTLFENADVLYCDGAGIRFASLLQQRQGLIPKRYANADWLFTMFDHLAENDCSLYYLGGEASVVKKGVRMYEESCLNSNIVGYHHGYILDNPELERWVIEDINRKKPDVLFVGLGCPLQEFWIEKYKDVLDVKLFYPIGASMDYITGKLPRCPVWLGDFGFEWLFRLAVEPRRLFRRYIVGNPTFLFRVLKRNYIEEPVASFQTLFQPQSVPRDSIGSASS